MSELRRIIMENAPDIESMIRPVFVLNREVVFYENGRTDFEAEQFFCVGDVSEEEAVRIAKEQFEDYKKDAASFIKDLKERNGVFHGGHALVQVSVVPCEAVPVSAVDDSDGLFLGDDEEGRWEVSPSCDDDFFLTLSIWR